MPGIDLDATDRGRTHHRGRRGGPLRFVIFLVFVFLLIVVLANYYANHVDAGVAVLQERGYPISLQEMDATYALPAAELNAAEAYGRAFELVRAMPPEISEQGAELTTLIDEATGTGSPLSPEVSLRLEAYVAAHAHVLDAVFAIPPGALCRYPLDLTEGVWVELNHLAPARSIARLMRHAALAAAGRGDGDAVARALHAGLDVAVSLREEPLLLSQLVRCAILEIVGMAITESLAHCVLTEKHLIALDAKLQDAPRGVGVDQVIATEYLCMIDVLRKREVKFEMPGGWREFVQMIDNATGASLRREFGGLNKTSLAAALEDALLAPGELTHRYRAFIRDNRRVRGDGQEPRRQAQQQSAKPVYGDGMIYRVLLAHTRTQTSLAMVRCIIGVERFRLATGALPRAINDLAPDYLDPLPQDPYGEGPFRYRQTDTGYVLYSLSEDFEDNGGKEDSLHYLRGEDWGYHIQYHCQ